MFFFKYMIYNSLGRRNILIFILVFNAQDTSIETK